MLEAPRWSNRLSKRLSEWTRCRVSKGEEVLEVDGFEYWGSSRYLWRKL